MAVVKGMHAVRPYTSFHFHVGSTYDDQTVETIQKSRQHSLFSSLMFPSTRPISYTIPESCLCQPKYLFTTACPVHHLNSLLAQAASSLTDILPCVKTCPQTSSSSRQLRDAARLVAQHPAPWAEEEQFRFLFTYSSMSVETITKLAAVQNQDAASLIVFAHQFAMLLVFALKFEVIDSTIFMNVYTGSLFGVLRRIENLGMAYECTECGKSHGVEDKVMFPRNALAAYLMHRKAKDCVVA